MALFIFNTSSSECTLNCDISFKAVFLLVQNPTWFKCTNS